MKLFVGLAIGLLVLGGIALWAKSSAPAEYVRLTATGYGFFDVVDADSRSGCFNFAGPKKRTVCTAVAGFVGRIDTKTKYDVTELRITQPDGAVVDGLLVLAPHR